MRQWIACNARPIIIRSNELVAFHQLHCRQNENMFSRRRLSELVTRLPTDTIAGEAWRSYIRTTNQRCMEAQYRGWWWRTTMRSRRAINGRAVSIYLIALFCSLTNYTFLEFGQREAQLWFWYIVQIKHDSMKDTQKNQRTIEAGVVLSFRRNRAEFIWRKSSQKDVKQSENQSSCWRAASRVWLLLNVDATPF